MPPQPPQAPRSPLPAFVLASALLGALAAGGAWVVGQMRMAPGTLLSAEAQAAVAQPGTLRASAAVGAVVTPAPETGPAWHTLNTPQKLALYPLAERWALLSEVQKRRWLALAGSFASLPEDEQAKFHARMTDWASLSAQQRNQARLNYAVTNRLAPDDKRAQWEAYQALSEEERRALAARAAPRPKGAAIALRPVSPKKLAQVPAATQAGNPSQPNAPKIPLLAEHAPRIVMPALAAPAATGAHPAPAAAPAESAPVAVPVAVPSALPPLGAVDAPGSAPVSPAPDNSSPYLQ